MFDADLWLYYAVVYTFAEQEKIQVWSGKITGCTRRSFEADLK